MLTRAKNAAYNQKRTEKSKRFSNEIYRRESIEKLKISEKNYNEFMKITQDKLLGSSNIEIDSNSVYIGDEIKKIYRLCPLGDTWIRIISPDISAIGFKPEIINLYSDTDQSGVYSLSISNNEKNINIKDLVLTRSQAIGFHKFLNWWYQKQEPFNINNFTIKGEHV
jgi:hypothetical protein